MTTDSNSRTADRCPECGSDGRVVTAVTITTLDTDPRRVLVTRQCSIPTCMFKYPVVQPEPLLTDDEVAVWRRLAGDQQ